MLSIEEPALTTGWETDLDVGDTVLRRFVVHLGDYYSSVADLTGSRWYADADLCVVDPARPLSYFASALIRRPPAPDAWNDVLDRLEAVVVGSADGRGTVYCWSPWPTPDLRPRGWTLTGHPPLLVRGLGGPVPAPSIGLAIREVRDERALADWERVAVEGYPMPDLVPYRPGALFDRRILGDRRWRLWVGYDGDEPLAIGTLYVAHGFAQFALAATMAKARRRGAWSGLVRERLLAAPDVLVGGVFSDDSRPGMERLGFLPIVRFTLWQRDRG